MSEEALKRLESTLHEYELDEKRNCTLTYEDGFFVLAGEFFRCETEEQMKEHMKSMLGRDTE